MSESLPTKIEKILEGRKIKVPEEEYRAMRRARKRQLKAKRLVLELWQMFSNVK